MADNRLTVVQRWSFGFAGVISGGIAAGFTAVALFAPAEFPFYGRICFVVGALFAGFSAVLGIRVFERGTLELATDPTVYYAMAWIFSVFMLTLVMICAPNNLAGLRMITCVIPFFVAGIAFLLRDVMDRSAVQGREHLLKMERRLEEIEKLLKASAKAEFQREKTTSAVQISPWGAKGDMYRRPFPLN